MKVIIAGSRNVTVIKAVYTAIRESGFEITEVVCGEARGVDLLGRLWATQHKIPLISFPVDWNHEGRSAGYLRNLRMADYAEALIAIWDGQSRGTQHMIKVATTKGLKVFVYRTDS